MPVFVKVATRSEIPKGTCRAIEVDGRRIALFNLEGGLYAIDEECTHSGGPLSEGEIDGEEIECPWHQGRFNIRTGEVVDAPPMDDLTRYNVRLRGEDVEIEI